MVKTTYKDNRGPNQAFTLPQLPFPPCLCIGEEYGELINEPVAPPPPGCAIIGAARAGRKIIAALRRDFLKRTRKRKIAPRRPVSIRSKSLPSTRSGAVRDRAPRSHAAHGARKADDGCASGACDPPPSPRPRWLLIADRSTPRIEVAAIETIDGRLTRRKVETTASTRAEALAELSRLVSRAGGVAAWGIAP